MGLFDKVVAVSTGGLSEVVKSTDKDDVVDVLTTVSTGGLNKVKESADKKADEEKAAQAAIASEEEALKAKREELRQVEFDRAVGQQTEAEQLAQRALFRQQQQQAASVQNIQAQSGFTSSAVQGVLSSSQTTTAAESGALAGTLEGNVDFLQTTFDLGGDISSAAQRLQSSQQAQADRAQQRAGVIGGLGSGAGLAALIPGVGPGAIVAGAVIGAAVGGDVDVFEEIGNLFDF